MTALGHGTDARKEADGLASAAAESPLFALASFVAA